MTSCEAVSIVWLSRPCSSRCQSGNVPSTSGGVAVTSGVSLMPAVEAEAEAAAEADEDVPCGLDDAVDMEHSESEEP